MKFDVITSFNETYYNNIGKDCVETWLKYWPAEMSLTCYVEEFELPAQDRIKQITFDQLPAEYSEFQKSDERGRVKLFAKKAYSIIHAMNNTDADRIIWVDADVITEKPLPISVLEKLCKKDQLATYMQVYHEVDDKTFVSAETGFFILNTRHEYFPKFRDRYTEYYNKHLKENLRRFYDGEVFGAVISELETECSVNNLCKDFEKKYKSPLKHTPLGEYIIHHKSKHSKDNYGN